MLYLDCQHDPVRLTEHFRGTRESEQTKSWYQFCCNHIRQGFGVKMSHLWVPTNGHWTEGEHPTRRAHSAAI